MRPEFASDANHTILQLDDVGKTFRSDAGADVTALASVDLTIRQGEFVTLVGATGCGKTTLLDLAAGITEPSAGHLRRGSGVRLGQSVAYVFQHYTLFPWRTTLTNVAFGLQMRGIGRRQARTCAMELLARVGLAGFEKGRPHELSGGMRQRAAIAQALAIEPVLLLMDEPFGAVDDATRAELQRMLVDLWQDRGMTILFVTHNIDEAILLGTRVVVFGGPPGRVVRQFDIDLPRPRDRNMKPFTNLFLDVRQALAGGLD
ncbi:MAG: ABC transporter ATP-binding protein [Sedimentisphaerales bacterium]|nr:ABC transporter ATP-binding protein [Sedimentisphaerales bacterium]